MLAFFGQPKFALNATDYLPVGYELFIREQAASAWHLPDDFNAITVDQFYQLLLNVTRNLPSNVQLLSFNLEQQQFIQPAFADMIEEVQHQTALNIFTELTERNDPLVSDQQLLAAAQGFHRRDLLVCIDDVGTGENTSEMVLKLDDYVDEYKFAFQNFRPFTSIHTIEPELKFWADLRRQNHKILAIEGIETAAELTFVRRQYPCNLIQGYYTGRPELLATS
ncbi:MAG: EAL domain-containing protein [Lactobacillus sp.]|nr:MAG: EAL domain-containing protein [Lactobacillus sp.]